MVGAGGIGATLMTAFSRYEFETVSAILMLVILLVFGAEPVSKRIRFLVLLGSVAGIVQAWSWISERTTWAFVFDAWLQGADLVDRMFPPEVSYAATIFRPMVDTLHITTLGTLLGGTLALPLAFAAALPTSPSRRMVRSALH